jgi:CBS domain-containing protein
MITAEDILKEKTQQLVTVPLEATVYEAIEKMTAHRIGAILIKKEDQIIGIWSERDFLRNTLEPGFDPKIAKIVDYMQTELKTAPFDTPIIKLEEMFLGLFIRHILITKNEQYLGVLSIGDVIRAILLERDREIQSLHAKGSWEYYENWGWHQKQSDKPKKD